MFNRFNTNKYKSRAIQPLPRTSQIVSLFIPPLHGFTIMSPTANNGVTVAVRIEEILAARAT
jgi:hypothetical protein